MLDVVLARRRGLPILLSVVYIEVARRADIPIAGVGFPGHFVVAHFGTRPPLLMDPFRRGAILSAEGGHEVVRPSPPHEIAMRMLNNLVGSYERRATYRRHPRSKLAARAPLRTVGQPVATGGVAGLAGSPQLTGKRKSLCPHGSNVVSL